MKKKMLSHKKFWQIKSPNGSSTPFKSTAAQSSLETGKQKGIEWQLYNDLHFI